MSTLVPQTPSRRVIAKAGRAVVVRGGGLVGPAGAAGAAGAAGPTGPAGAQGPPGADGADGADGTGVPNGGTIGQVLTKQSNADGDADWDDPAGGAASLPDLLPGPVTAPVLGGTVNVKGIFEDPEPATGIAAEATVQSLLSSVTALYTTIGEALTNGFLGVAIADEGP